DIGGRLFRWGVFTGYLRIRRRGRTTCLQESTMRGRQKTTLLIAGLATLWLVTVRPTAAQLQTGFEAGDGYNGSAAGTVLTGQNGWLLPNNVSTDFSVFTYDSNALGIPT